MRPARSPKTEPAALAEFMHDSGKSKAKRLNTEIHAALHARVKSRCALEGRDMTQILIELLGQRFPAERQKPPTAERDPLDRLESMSI